MATTIQSKRKSHIIFLALGFAAMTLAGCASYRPAPPAFHEALNQPYLLDAGDRVRITVFEQPSLSNNYSVDQSGYIAFPLIGSVPARGKTSKQLESIIASKLRGGYLRDPDVSVEVDRYRPIFVMGEVGAAGQYSYVPGMTVQKAIAAAGGFSPRANQENVDI
ncbi:MULTISPECIES: polysaccharide biosynthesis/export family protein, partial [Brucella]